MMFALTQSPATALSEGTLIVSCPPVKAALTPPLFASVSCDTSEIGDTGVSEGCEAAADALADGVGVGASVTLENLSSGDVLVTETDEFGDFWFHQVEPAAYRVYVEAEGYLTRMVDSDAVDKDCNVGPIDVFAAPQA